MRILADENITNVKEYFSPYGEVVTVPGRTLTKALVQDFDALLVRSVTKVNEALLSGTRCRFVASATSGVDHVDLDALQAMNIAFSAAPGCNATSVVDYVFAALAALGTENDTYQDWRKFTFGIIGCGHIGSILAGRLIALGCRVAVYDPLLPESHPLANRFTDFLTALSQQVVSFHVPYTEDGPHPTRYMLNEAELCKLQPGAVLINAARGGVINNKALLKHLHDNPDLHVVLDAWEGEPAISLALLDRVDLGTAHIAGYSHEGKLRGTAMIRDAFCKQFGLPEGRTNSDGTGEAKQTIRVTASSSASEQLNTLLLYGYDIRRDSARLKCTAGDTTPAEAFDLLRKQYPTRHEYSHFLVSTDGLAPTLRHVLPLVGFELQE